MTPRQAQTFRFIEQFIAERGYGPSYREIAEGIGMSPRSKQRVSIYVHELVAAGYLSVFPERARAITVLRPIRALYEVHVFNDVTKALEPYSPSHLEAAE